MSIIRAGLHWSQRLVCTVCAVVHFITLTQTQRFENTSSEVRTGGNQLEIIAIDGEEFTTNRSNPETGCAARRLVVSVLMYRNVTMTISIVINKGKRMFRLVRVQQE